jgi:hypothetical protein
LPRATTDRLKKPARLCPARMPAAARQSVADRVHA